MHGQHLQRQAGPYRFGLLLYHCPFPFALCTQLVLTQTLEVLNELLINVSLSTSAACRGESLPSESLPRFCHFFSVISEPCSSADCTSSTVRETIFSS
jgi:hypothetical protein